MTILNQLNSAPMYLICGGIIAFVAVVCVIFSSGLIERARHWEWMKRK